MRYFLTGPYSAHHQQAVLAKRGVLPTKHNLLISVYVFFWDLFDVIGFPVIMASIIFLISYFFFKNKKQPSFVMTMLSLPLMILVTMFLGITVIYIPQLRINNVEGGLFNVRYALMSMPLVAFSLSLLIDKRVWLTIFLLCLLIAQQYYFIASNQVYLIKTALIGQERASYYGTEIASALKKYCTDKKILMSAAFYDPIFLKSNLNIKNFIYEGSYKYWQESLINPTKYIKCIVMGNNDNPDDTVRTALMMNQKFYRNYVLLTKTNTISLYGKK